MSLAGVLTLGVLVIMTSAGASNPKPHYNLHDAPKLFAKFVKDYKRIYKDDADREVHYEAFVKTLKLINKENKGDTSATFDINQFADFTEEELKHITGFNPKKVHN